MADTVLFEEPTAGEDTSSSATFTDYAKAGLKGAADVGESLASGGRASGDAIGSPAVSALSDFFRKAFQYAGDTATESMSSGGRAALESSIASPDFWEHPVSATFLKAINMTPQVAAAVVPAALFPEGVLAETAVAGAGAALGAGMSAQDVYDQTDKMSDPELQAAMPYYAQLRAQGVSEDEARADANTKLMGLKPLLNAAAGAAAMALGPAGRAAGLVPEAAGAGLIKRALVGGGEGLTGGALMGGVGEATHEQTQVDLDQRTELDPAQILAATADSALTQGVMGAAGGALIRTAPEAPGQDLRRPETLDARSPDQAQTSALEGDQPPATPVAPAQAEPAPAPEPTFRTNPAKIADEHAAEVSSQEAQGAAAAANDAGKTVPEPQATLNEQRDQLVAGQRKAVLYPKGNPAKPEIPDGMKRVMTKDGTFVYDPKKITPKEIYDASKAKTLNTVLSLGDFSKQEVMARVGAGETPLAVTERTPGGTEVKAAAGTDQTAPHQIASLEASKTPGNTVAIEHPAAVLNDRVAAAKAAGDAIRQKPGQPQDTVETMPPKVPQGTKRAPKPKAEPAIAPHKGVNELSDADKAAIDIKLDQIRRAAEQQEAAGTPIKGGIAAFMERKRDEYIAHAKGPVEVQEPAATRARATQKDEGRHYTATEVAGRTGNNMKASELIARERFSPAKNESREDLLDRVRGMVETAEKEGVSIPQQIRDITDKKMQHNSAVTLLSEAKTLVRADRAKRGANKDAVNRFISRETLLRSSDEKDYRQALEDRRVEANEKWSGAKARQQIETRDPEAEIAAERERLESVPDETNSPAEEAEGEENVAASKGKERERVALKGDEVVAGKDRAGTFKVEAKKKILRRMGGEDEHVEVTPETLAGVKPMRTASLGSLLDTRGGRDNALSAHIAPYITRRLRTLIGDTQVKIVTPTDMQLMGGGDSISGIAHGYTTNEDVPTIYVNSESAKNPRLLRHILLHEGMHAAVGRALEQSAEHLETIRQMMNETAEHLGEQAAGVYGLTDEHEFLSEAMSNPDFQQMLGEVKASKSLIKRLQLDSPLTLRDALVDLIRRILGLGKDQHSMIEAALRTSNQLMARTHNQDLSQPSGRFMRAGNFTDAGNQAHTDEINGMFRDSLKASLGRAKDRSVESAKGFVDQVTSPAKLYTTTINGAKATGGVLSKVLNAVTTNDQYRSKIEHLLPMSREIFDNIERTGVLANKLKDEGLDLAAALVRAQKVDPEAFERFSKLINDQTMLGADASTAIGEGRNKHLQLSKALMERIEKGEPIDDVAHEAALKSWEARAAHPGLQERYNMLVRGNREFGPLQKKLFDYFESTQREMMHGQIDSILRAYDFKGTDAERAKMAAELHQGKLTDEMRAKLEANISKQAAKQLEDTQALKVVKGPYAPQMRRGEHAVIGEYKVKEPTNGTKIDADTWEFKTRDQAHDFATKSGLHAEPKIVYYDTATGKPVASREDAISQGGQPEQRFRIKLQRQHLEFHESEADARAAMEAHKQSGLFDKVGLEARRHIESEDSQFSNRGMESLLRSLAAQKHYQDSTELEKATMRHTIREAALRSMSDNRVQSRRLPRRFVQGASDDIARNLYDYNNSQANYRANLKYRQTIDDGLKLMWDHVKENRFTGDNQQRSAAANEVERRVRAPDPNEGTGAWTSWSRRLMTWSYVDRMVRPSHLILHQTHLPMITAPYMAGRHGMMSAFGATLKAWKELSGAYSAGGHDAWATTAGSPLQKVTDYTELSKKMIKGAPDAKRASKMFDALNDIGLIHPSAGIEVGKYLPSKQLGGIVGGLDRGLNKVDTIFRQLTNATEAINRHAGALAAYRLEFGKLTRAGKSEAVAHEAAVEYARKTLADTQGLFSATNAAPLFKNKVLRPFLQFKQFPQMMYHLLSKLAVTALKGETKEAKIQAVASLASILGMHMMMAGVIQGLPLEAFKVIGMISKGLGLTDGDWSDVENAVTRSVNTNLGKDLGTLVTRGLGAEMGVDVHHRLGLNSFVTYGMPDQLDTKSVSEFMLNAVGGAPYGMVKDAGQGISKMMNGDVEAGALQAFPLQAFRDIHNAINPADNSYGYEPTAADRVKSLAGFTPEAKAVAAEKREAIYNATQEYDQERAVLIKSWVNASPAERNDIWNKIQDWNAGRSYQARVNKGDLFKSLANRAAGNASGNRLDNIKLNSHNQDVARRAADLYQ